MNIHYLPEVEEDRQFFIPSDLLKSIISETVFAVSTQKVAQY